MQRVDPEVVGLSAARLDRITPVLQGYVDRGEFAGMIALVARRGKVAYFEKFGFQDIESGTEMRPDTIFRIYSMTKPITSAAAMMLAEEGRLRLSDPVSRYIPAFRNLRVMIGRGAGDYDLVEANRAVTVHDLFTHTAGLSYGFDSQSTLDDLYRREVWETIEKNPDATLEEFVSLVARLPLSFHPGTAFRYSVSIDVLGYIVQLVSGLPLDAFLEERIFEPLGMSDTAFFVPREKVDRLATVYGLPGASPLHSGDGEAGEREVASLVPLDRPEESRFARPTRNYSGGGGLVSTASDYFRFGQMMMNQGDLDGVRLLGRKTVEWMMQNHLPEGLVANGNPANGFGLGGSVLLRPGLLHQPGSVGRFGWGGAANTEWWIDPREELHCIFMAQYMPAFTIPVVEDFGMLACQALE